VPSFLKRTRTVAILCAALFIGGTGHFAAQEPISTPKDVRVVIQTENGNIELSLDAADAPITTTNFLRYVEGGFYNGGNFNRTVTPSNQPNNPIKIEVIEGGIDPAREPEKFAPVVLERTNKTGIPHVDGAVSMGRLGPDTATSDFFICVGDQPALDFGGMRNPDGQGFAAFGRVVRGMDMVRQIQKSPADGQTLNPPIKIIRVTRKL
jgi:peptidyl-prolyl cis-trans isomerase A (cyclophilin A)